MKVSELIEALQQFNGDLEIIMGSDDEGNDYIEPYHPRLYYCAEDDTRCGWRPVDKDDIENGEYEYDELVEKVVM